MESAESRIFRKLGELQIINLNSQLRALDHKKAKN